MEILKVFVSNTLLAAIGCVMFFLLFHYMGAVQLDVGAFRIWLICVAFIGFILTVEDYANEG